MPTALLAGMLATAGCGDDSGSASASDGSTTAGAPTSTSTGAATDSGTPSTTAAVDDTSGTATDESTGPEPTTGGVAGCQEQLTLNETFAMLPDEGTTQIHAHARFDPMHQGLWLAYTRPANDGTSDLQTALARVGCDGTVQMAPIAASTSVQNHVDPEVVVSDTRVLVIWAGDDGTGGSGNLDVLTRLFDRDGQPLGDAEQPLALTRAGAPFTGSAWMVHAAAAPDDTFVVAGTRAVEEVSAFHLFVQRLSLEGIAAEPTIEPVLQPGFAHTEPRIAIGDDGTAHIAWSATEDFSSYQVSTLSLPAGDDGSMLTAQPLGPEGDHAAVTAGAQPLWGNSVAEPSGRGIRVVSSPGGTPLSLSEGGRIDHSPTLQTADTHAALAWFRLVSGTRNEVVVTRVDGVGTDALVAGEELLLPDAEAAPYPLSLTHVGQGVYLVVWSQGQSPDFVIYGRFVDLGR